ncbi:hypothetical protein CCUS01_11273 [Colletotrichum cuscutae]|uniref:Uncharacterized protein n=2 Tax=Colletotrichum acutatum species complex TaxID=2707335 RepID=A0AAI9U3N7_9PEZI|nr:hypothetical protein CCUS01_11273 [Colletotrichum cuscutae]
MEQHSSEQQHHRGPRSRRPGKHRLEAWLWKDVHRQVIHSIDHPSLVPSEASVSSASRCELVCSYNWVVGQDEKIHIPGSAAVF